MQQLNQYSERDYRFASAVVTKRLAIGLTQQGLAALLGISSRAVENWEQGITTPKVEHLRHFIALCIEHQVFSAGQELQEARALWHVARCKVLFDDQWLRALLEQVKAPYDQVSPQEDGSVSLAEPGHTLLEGSKLQPTLHERSASGQSPSLLDPLMPNLPGPTGHVLGRDCLLTQIKQQLLEGDNLPLAALSGLPGIGKTALAVEIAADEQVRAHFSDGILWAALGPHPQVLGQLARWGTLLEIKPTDVEVVASRDAWGRAIRAVIGLRRMLLVIDDAWNERDALALRVGGAHCAHLLTTRSPQVAYAFASEGAMTVPELKETDGLALLARWIPQLVAEDKEGTLGLVRAVGSLPLALRLLGNTLAAQVFTGQPRRVQAAFAQLQEAAQRLRMSMATAPAERPPNMPEDTLLSLQAVIGVSEQQLGEEARTALHALAVFPPKPNSFSEEAALTVSQTPVEVLDELWDAGLLESCGPGRYTLHQTIVDYARLPAESMTAQTRLVR